MPDAATVVRAAAVEGIRPDLALMVSEWADLYRQLPQKSSAEPGPWRTARTPYLREIMDCLSARSEVDEVAFMKGAQIGGTEAILNVIGYAIDHAPGPILAVQPTVDLAKRFSRQRVDPLVEWTPRLRGKVADVRSRDSANTILAKDFLGGMLVLTGANSAVGLRSMPARWLLLDEIDAYPDDVDNEGSPIELAEARQRTFARRKRIKVSTPDIAGYSKIEEAYLASDRRRYYVPCPDCGEMQPLEFPRLTWSKFDLPPSRAVYVCRACEVRIQNHQKTAMLIERGFGGAAEWRPENPDASPRVRGYHLSSLYSPVGWLSWGEIAERFVRDHRSPERFKVFVNTILGETWKSRGDALDWEMLYRRRESYSLGSVPLGGLFLTVGVDVQKDRLEAEIVAWGRGKTSWSVDYLVLPGDTADLDRGPWKDLDALLARTFTHEGGADLVIRMLAVDSGYNTQTVHAWARRYPMSRVIAIKGEEGAAGGLLIGAPRAIDVTAAGKPIRRGYKHWPVYGHVAKSELHGFLTLAIPTDGGPPPPGYCHFPQYGEEYFKQLTAEELAPRKNRRGYVRLEWSLRPGRRNEALDCRNYARSAAAVVGLDRFRESDWQSLETALGVTPRVYDDEVPE
jgi:phage terminase large subunit GpA-like protein